MRRESYKLDEYLQELEQLAGSCVICAVNYKGLDKGRNHMLENCGSRFSFFQSKKAVMNATRGRDGSYGWFSKFSCCYTCFQPQEICSKEDGKCGRMYKDILLPACWQAWKKTTWVQKHLPKISGKENLSSELEFLKWIG